jgi:hypothetical protein
VHYTNNFIEKLKFIKKNINTSHGQQHLKDIYGTLNMTESIIKNINTLLTLLSDTSNYTFRPYSDNGHYASVDKDNNIMNISIERFWILDLSDNNIVGRLAHEFSHMIGWTVDALGTTNGYGIDRVYNRNGNNFGESERFNNADNFRYFVQDF